MAREETAARLPVEAMRRIGSAPWWLWILAVNLALVVATLVTPYLPEAGPRWLRPFADLDLAAEMTFAAWWSSALLLVASLLAYHIYSTRSAGQRLPWLILAVVLAGLSFDEVGSVHERVGSGGWRDLIIVGALVAGGMAYALLTLFQRRDSRKTAVLVAVGLGLMATVAAQEFVEHIVSWPAWAVGPRAAIEEGTELAGMLLCLMAIAGQVPGRTSFSLSRIIPDPSRLRHLPVILLLGLAFQILVSFPGASLTDIPRRGNPAAWYPMAVLFLGASAAFWQAWSSSERRKGWLFCFLSLMLLSIGTLYQIRALEIRSVGDALGWGLYAFFLFGLIAFVYSTARASVVTWNLVSLAVIVIVWLAGLITERGEVLLIAVGATACLVAIVFVGARASQVSPVVRRGLVRSSRGASASPTERPTD